MKNNILLLWVYLLLSWFLFFITSAGWTMWLFRLFGYGVLFVFIGVIFTFRYYKNKPNSQKIISKPLIVAQLLALLFNFGDCGDANGSLNFLERLLLINGWNFIDEPCQPPYLDQLFFDDFARTTSNICFLIYFVILIVFIAKQSRIN
jgi:hypothetical protein